MAAPKPEIAPQGKPQRLCVECGSTFTPNRPQQNACTRAHNIAFRNRLAARGQVILPYALAVNMTRHAAASELRKFARRELTAILSDFAAEDKTANRPPITDYVAAIMASGYRYMDRKR